MTQVRGGDRISECGKTRCILFFIAPSLGVSSALCSLLLRLAGKLSVSLSNVLLIVAFGVGCFGIYRSHLGIHSTIIFCFLLGVVLTSISWWIQPTANKEKGALLLQVEFRPEYQLLEGGERIKTDRIKVHNLSATTEARNVTASIISIDPRPKNGLFKAHYPYKLSTKWNKSTTEYVTINPHDDEYFMVAKSWPGADGNVYVVIEPDKEDWARYPISPDEVWTMKIKVSSANAGSKELDLFLYTEHNELIVSSEQPKQPAPKEIPKEETKAIPTQPKTPLSFLLADCTFDGRFEVQGNYEAFRKAFPQAGPLYIIMDFYPENEPKEIIEMQLSGRWQGTTGMVDIPSEDSIIFVDSERMFVLYHKKPIIEGATIQMTHLQSGKEYVVDFIGMPGFGGTPLFPLFINIRTHEGQLLTITNFILSKGPGHRYCYATFRF